MRSPNILLIMLDQWRHDAMGCASSWVRTPNVDRIAAEGVRFTQCVTNSPICVPARVSLATGLYPHNTSVWQNVTYTLPPDHPTWMQAIRNAGYRTSLFGKTHLHPHRLSVESGGDLRTQEHLLHAYGLDDVDEICGPQATVFTMSHMAARWEEKGLLEAFKADVRDRNATKPHIVRPSPLPLEEYYDVYVGNQASRYLEQYDRSQPWFCWVSFAGPHEPWDAPEPYASMYDPASMPAPLARFEDNPDRPSGHLDKQVKRAPELDPGEAEMMRANYAGNVTLIDDQIGRLLDVVERRGELDNTVIVLVSDHGEMNGDHGLIKKGNFLDSALRVPLIVRTPQTAQSSQRGTLNESLVEWFDVGPTLVELAGGEVGYEQFARSLVPVVEGSERVHREEVLSEIHGEMMLMDHRWKIVVNREGKPYLLFDRQEDPDEQRNLAGRAEYRDVEQDLCVRLLERVVQTQRREP